MPARKPGNYEPTPAAYAGVMVSMPMPMFAFMSVVVVVMFLCCAVRMMHAGLPFPIASLRRTRWRVRLERC